ncbi:uncharacterized protein LOC126314448 [Schistocerca gregaria]|uniref:uncharacterized protein LOC126314448 n=1 Tax=Schistocerca gregaria TaxID=7010 RepID=UPI00211DB322|nr:uncharacterized protein LOC126314448 [Schistocerca gregaria]
MKSFWSLPNQFVREYRLSIESGRIKEPIWWKYIVSEQPGQYYIAGEKPWKEIKFPTDAYRRLYYKDYPFESNLYSHSSVPGESKYYKAPVDRFIERLQELIQQGLDGNLAYLQCKKEKDMQDECQDLERYFCAHQAVHLYGLNFDETEESENQKQRQTPYERARAAIFKDTRDRLRRIIRAKREINPNAKLTRKDVENLSQEEIFHYIRTNPEDASYLDSSVFWGINHVFDPQPCFENANDRAVKEYFGVPTCSDPSKWAQAEITQENLDGLLEDTRKLILSMNDEMGIKEQEESLFDSLSESGRIDVLSQWMNYMPDSKEWLERPYYSSSLSEHLQTYEKDISQSSMGIDPIGAEPDVLKGIIDKRFSEFDAEWEDHRKKTGLK